jgi:hypothetical protein
MTYLYCCYAREVVGYSPLTNTNLRPCVRGVWSSSECSMRMNGNMPMTMGTLAKITIFGEYAVLKISELLQS